MLRAKGAHDRFGPQLPTRVTTFTQLVHTEKKKDGRPPLSFLGDIFSRRGGDRNKKGQLKNENAPSGGIGKPHSGGASIVLSFFFFFFK